MADESKLTKSLAKSKAKGEIEFKNVKFGYQPGKTIINNFSAKAKPGEKIAIVGPTGAGKTTMVNLLMKFYEVNSGDILIDGVSTKELSRENIHNLFIMVLQDTWLFDGSIGDNIRFNKKNVSDEEIKGNILAASYKSETFIDSISLDSDDVVIIGDRYKIQKYAVESGIKLMIIVNNGTLNEELLDIAKKNKVNVISVPISTFKCSNMIKLCNYVKLININDEPIKFSIYDYRDDFIEITSKYGHTNYPIVNHKNECLGMIQVIDSSNYEKKKVILVDHNQNSQSADGIEEADIVEVIDHHNLGVFGTTTPINFRSMPVGCTSTIIYQLYKENNVKIPSNIAGIMLSAILSDTLLFKSPTTTDLDIETGKELAKIAHVNYEKYGMEMFRAASSIEGLSIEEIINSDIKSFVSNDIPDDQEIVHWTYFLMKLQLLKSIVKKSV